MLKILLCSWCGFLLLSTFEQTKPVVLQIFIPQDFFEITTSSGGIPTSIKILSYEADLKTELYISC